VLVEQAEELFKSKEETGVDRGQEFERRKFKGGRDMMLLGRQPHFMKKLAVSRIETEIFQ
jgi:hypothetical protein